MHTLAKKDTCWCLHCTPLLQCGLSLKDITTNLRNTHWNFSILEGEVEGKGAGRKGGRWGGAR